jgi:ATP-dependent exoDNAse (exonuclease V) beta subunit
MALLSETNRHPRDSRITFEEEGHKYTLQGLNGVPISQSPISVTTLIHHWFPVFDKEAVAEKLMKGRNWEKSQYFGKTKEEIIKQWDDNGTKASGLGTLMHADIERYLNNIPVLNDTTKEFSHFRNFWTAFQETNPSFKPYRTEWVVFDEDKIVAGSIDCVLSDGMGNLIILDWKRSKEIKMKNDFRERGLGPFVKMDHCNFNHYSLQLNIYRYLLETKYQRTVVAMFIVVLHPDNETFQIHQIQKHDIGSVWDTITNIHEHK